MNKLKNKRKIRSIYFLILTLLLPPLLLPPTPIFPAQWNIDLKIFSLSMTIQEVQNSLSQFQADYQKIKSYHTTNPFFLSHNPSHYRKIYYNDQNLKIIQYNSPKNPFINGQLTLKKILGIKIGQSKHLHGFKVLHTPQNNPQNSNFTPKLSYHYRSFPVKTINPLIHSANLAFFDQKLFQIIYHVHLSNPQYSQLTQEINTHPNFKIIPSKPNSYQKLNSQISISIQKLQNQCFLIQYQNPKLSQLYQLYLQKSKQKFDQIIQNHQLQDIRDFLNLNF